MRNFVVAVSIGLLLSVSMANSQELQSGPEHQRLGYYVGTWKVDVTIKETPMGPAGKEV